MSLKSTSLKIGAVTIDNPVVLAPMSGVTDMPFRRLVKRLGVGLVVSEMIASKAMVYAARKTMKMASLDPDEQPVSVQLAGCDADIIADAARINQDRGAAIIDINMGCPVKKVTNGDAGSALMRDLNHAKTILETVVKAVSIPVTLKMRTGWDHDNRNATELAHIAESSGIKALAVHGRTRCQFYKGVSDWDYIGKVKQSVSIPVFGNGDVNTLADCREMFARSGADGVLIGRGTYGRPWFPNQVATYLKTGEIIPDPDIHTQLEIVEEHYASILNHYGTQPGVRIARKHLGWYSKGLPNSAEFRARVNTMSDPGQVIDTVRHFYHTSMERVAA